MAPLAFDHLLQALDQQFASLPDCRTGQNTQDAIEDAALGAFAGPLLIAFDGTAYLMRIAATLEPDNAA
jgi:hypothetical protein